MTVTFNLLINELIATETAFLSTIKGLSGVQWSYKPEAGVWSATEVAEHVAVVETSISRLIVEQILQRPIPVERRAELKGNDAKITALMFDRSKRRDSPESVRPTGRWPTGEAAGLVFKEARDRLIEWVSRSDADLRGYGSEHPVFGMLDGKQWLLFAAAHCARHTRQIGELRKRPEFPPS